METGLPAVTHWTFTQKFLLRFFAAYFFLYVFPFPIGYVPFTETVTGWLVDVWDPLVYWAGEHILHVGYKIEVKPNGSGDTTYNYVQLFLIVMLALIAAIAWTALDRKRKSYDLLLYWVMVYVRYYLAFTLLGYGFFKVIKTQFPFPFYHLTETYAESSPMGLLWNFMGYSKAYNVFTGSAEVIGGLLLLFRKTTTLGALVVIVVMSNVVALNFCFDVPVKLYSSNLLLMAVFVIAPDLKRLINVLIRNKAVPAVNLQPRFPKRWQKISWISVKLLLIASTLYLTVSMSWDGYLSYGDEVVQKKPLFGIYNVETFVKNKDTLLPLATDSLQWKQINMARGDYAVVKAMNDSLQGYGVALDTAKKTIQFTSTKDSYDKASFHFFHPDSSHLVFAGSMNNDSVYIIMKRFDPNNSLLMSRGFHWINEYPFNR